jgi:hypothetical protein
MIDVREQASLDSTSQALSINGLTVILLLLGLRCAAQTRQCPMGWLVTEVTAVRPLGSQG